MKIILFVSRSSLAGGEWWLINNINPDLIVNILTWRAIYGLTALAFRARSAQKEDELSA